MSVSRNATVALDIEALVCEIQNKCTEVANQPEHGFHFHTGRPLAAMLAYPSEVVRGADFVDVELGEMADVFSGSPYESDAKEFETRGVTFSARKPPAAAYPPGSPTSDHHGRATSTTTAAAAASVIRLNRASWPGLK